MQRNAINIEELRKSVKVREIVRQIIRAELEAFQVNFAKLLCKVSKPDDDKLLTRKFAAAELEVNVSTLWRYTKDKHIKPIKRIGRVYYRSSDIQKLKLNLSQL